jgi:hypothetical protein
LAPLKKNAPGGLAIDIIAPLALVSIAQNFILAEIVTPHKNNMLII